MHFLTEPAADLHKGSLKSTTTYVRNMPVPRRSASFLRWGYRLLQRQFVILYMTIETFPNPNTERAYSITHVNPEFTSMCPKTGLPDFGTITVEYIPDAVCIELKSLKYYYQDFRNRGIFYEAVTNKILDDLVAACNPKWMKITSEWTTRGGLHSIIEVEHVQS